MSRKTDLLKLFSQNTEYYFHIVPNELGHLIYVSQEKDEYTIEGLEFKLNSIIEGFLNKPEEIEFKKVAPSIYFTKETNVEKLKYELSEDMIENENFSSFIENIRNEYRTLEVEDFLIYEKDPKTYEKKKEEEYKQQQLETWERYKKQQEEQERIKRTAIKEYDNNLIKLFKDNLIHDIIKKDKKWNLKNPFSQIVYSTLTNNEEQGKLWPMREEQSITGNNKFEPISIEGNLMSIFIADRMSDSYIINFKLDGDSLNIDSVTPTKSDTKYMADYDFLMKIFDFDITPNFIDWGNMYENEKLDAVVDEIIKLQNEKKEQKEKEKNEIINSSKVKAFFTINKYEIQIGKIPGIIGENISDELFKVIEDKVTKLDIDFKRGEDLNNNIEFIETITFNQVEKIYKHLIENGYMLDTYRQEGEYPFMDLRKPDTSQHTIYVGWEDSEEQYSDGGYYDDEFCFNIYTSHTTDVVYDQDVGWITQRTEQLLKSLNAGDFHIDFGDAENLHSISIKNASKGDLKKRVKDFINQIKTKVDNSDGFKWYDNNGNNNINTTTNMNKNNFEIIIGDTPYEEWGLDKDEATPINGMVFYEGGIYDGHIDGHFPQLQTIGLVGEMEGQLSYDGNLNKQELVDLLIQMGFDARIGNLEI